MFYSLFGTRKWSLHTIHLKNQCNWFLQKNFLSYQNEVVFAGCVDGINTHLLSEQVENFLEKMLGYNNFRLNSYAHN